MAEILDHAITVRDVMWVWIGAFAMVLLAIGAFLTWLHLHDKKRDKRRALMRDEMDEYYAKNPIKRAQPTSYDRDGMPRYHIRNPAHGVPANVQWENGRPYVTE